MMGQPYRARRELGVLLGGKPKEPTAEEIEAIRVQMTRMFGPYHGWPLWYRVWMRIKSWWGR